MAKINRGRQVWGMNTSEQKIWKKNFLLIILASFGWGIFAHGFMMANKISLHDDMFCLFGMGGTVGSGRWMLGILSELTKLVFGSNYSLPAFNGFIAIMLIGLSACAIAYLYGMKNKGCMVLLAGIMVVFPSVTGSFGYMFTVPPYYVGFFMGVMGAVIICKWHYWFSYIAGVMLICCSIGVYQSFLPLIISLLLMQCICEVSQDMQASWGKYIKKCCYYGSAIVVSVGLYFVVNTIALRVTQMQLTDYKGISNYGYAGVRGYLERIIRSYQEFFFPSYASETIQQNMYPETMRFAYAGMVLLLIVLSIHYLIVPAWKKERKKALQLGVLCFLFPLAYNFIFVMVQYWFLYSLTMFGQISIFVALILFVDRKLVSIDKKWGASLEKYLAFAILIFSCIFYSRYANIAYFKIDMMKSQQVSYYTALITRIESLEGYQDTMPVAIIYCDKDDVAVDRNYPYIPELSNLWLFPAEGQPLQDDSCMNFMKYYCGFEPEYVTDVSTLEKNSTVINAPAYPNDGSVMILDGMVVVKVNRGTTGKG